jgi:tol-pal system protein YbgF
MKIPLIPVMVLGLLLLSNPLSAVKKDTQIILDELVKVTDQMNRMEEKVTILSSEWNLFGKRLEALENRILAMVNNQADSNEKRENLVLALQFVREELSEIKNSIGSLQNQLLSAVPASPAAADGGDDNPDSGVKPTPESVESIYYTAYSDYIKQDYDLAVKGFGQFIEKYPSSPLADNALYWIGECHYAQRQYEQAVTIFSQLITRYGEGDKVADATLKKGFALIEMGRQSEGISVLKELISKFPLSEEASLAQQKLNDIKG